MACVGAKGGRIKQIAKVLRLHDRCRFILGRVDGCSSIVRARSCLPCQGLGKGRSRPREWAQQACAPIGGNWTVHLRDHVIAGNSPRVLANRLMGGSRKPAGGRSSVASDLPTAWPRMTRPTSLPRIALTVARKRRPLPVRFSGRSLAW